MNGNCQSCDVEEQCGYEYKPCDCCNYRKFKEKPKQLQSTAVIKFPTKEKPNVQNSRDPDT